MSQPHSYTARNYGVLDWIQHSLPLDSKSLPKDGGKKPTKAFLYWCITSSKQTGHVWSALFYTMQSTSRNWLTTCDLTQPHWTRWSFSTSGSCSVIVSLDAKCIPPLEKLGNGSRRDLQIDGDVMYWVGELQVFSQSPVGLNKIILLWNIIVSPYSLDLKYFEQKLGIHQSCLFSPDLYFGTLILDTSWYWILMSSQVELKWCSF